MDNIGDVGNKVFFLLSLLELEVIDKQGEKARMIHEILNQMSLESYSAGR